MAPRHERGVGNIDIGCDFEPGDSSCSSAAPVTAGPFAWLLGWIVLRRRRRD